MMRMLPWLLLAACGDLSPWSVVPTTAPGALPPPTIHPVSPPPPFACITFFEGRYAWQDQTDAHVERVRLLLLPGSNLEGYTLGYAVDKYRWTDRSIYTPVSWEALPQTCGEIDLEIPVPWEPGDHQIQVALWRDDDPTLYSCIHMIGAADPVYYGIRSTPGWASYAVVGENARTYTMTHGWDPDWRRPPEPRDTSRWDTDVAEDTVFTPERDTVPTDSSAVGETDSDGTEDTQVGTTP